VCPCILTWALDRDRVADILTGSPKITVWSPARARNVSLPQNMQSGCGTHTASFSVVTRLWSWPLTSDAQFRNKWSFTSVPLVCLHGIHSDCTLTQTAAWSLLHGIHSDCTLTQTAAWSLLHAAVLLLRKEDPQPPDRKLTRPQNCNGFSTWQGKKVFPLREQKPMQQSSSQ
jgi:hypothetical protein